MSRPPIQLNALRAFEAAARHGSVKAAAQELNVSPSAVSHQIRQLENLLGSYLFERNGRGVELTDEGAKLLPKLEEGFGLIGEALAEHHAKTAAGPLRINVLETFALYWLSPRLKSYPLGRGGFDLEIAASQRVVSFETENVDLAIRTGHGSWPGVECEHLFPERLGLYVSPAWSAPPTAGGPLFLSKHRQAEWAEWQPNLSGSDLEALTVVLVDSTSLAIKAALDGAGYCVAGDPFVRLEIADGRLKVVEVAPVPSSMGGYWLVYRKGARRDPRVRHFRSWLFEEIERASDVSELVA